jgi:hypothetical protein
MSPVVPPLLARILHYGPGDLVNTPYGQGSVISSRYVICFLDLNPGQRASNEYVSNMHV